MTGGAHQPGRLTPAQAAGWLVAFLIIALLIVLFFVNGKQVRPILGVRPGEAWQQNSS